MAETYDAVGAHGELDDLSTTETLTIPAGANGVVVQVYAQNVHYTVDGVTDPAEATVPFVLEPGMGERLLAFAPGTIIQLVEAAASATAAYQYVRVFERYWGQ